MIGTKRATGRRGRKAATLFAAVGVFVLFMLGLVSDRASFMEERTRAQLEESHESTDADGKRTFVYVIPPDPSFEKSLDEFAAYRWRMGQQVAWCDVGLSVAAFTFLALYFPLARRRLGECLHGDPLQSAESRALPRRRMKATLVAVGFAGLLMTLVVALLWVMIVWLDWRGALESVAGRARTVLLSGIAAKTALGAGICSLVFLSVTEWVCRQRIEAQKIP